MPDTQLVNMTEATILALTDILYAVVDPSGTPADRKITVGNLMKFADGVVISDENGNEILKILKTASAVNEIEFQNGATGQNAVIRASGETNIGLTLTGKGTGKISIGDGADPTKLLEYELVGATTAKKVTIVSSHTDDRTITLPNATTVLAGLAVAQTFTTLQTFSAGIDLSGSDIDNIQNLIHDQSAISYNATIAFDFALDQEQTMAVTGDLSTLTTSNRVAGKSKTVFLSIDSTDRILVFNSSWKVENADSVVTLPADSVCKLSLRCIGTAETDIVAEIDIFEAGYFFNEDFVTDDWTDNGVTTKVNTGTNVLDWDSDTNDNGARIDMAGIALSDTAWIARFPLIVAGFSGTGNHQFLFCVNTRTEFTGATNTRDFLGMSLVKSTSDTYRIAYGDGVVYDSRSAQNFTHALQAETVYVEWIRLSATSFRINLYSDSAFSSLIETQTAPIPSTIQGLRYMMAIEADYGGTATLNGTIPAPVQIKNGVTSW